MASSCVDYPLSLPVTTQTDERPPEKGPEKVIHPLPIQEPQSSEQLEDTPLPPCAFASDCSQAASFPTLMSTELQPDTVGEAPLPPPLPPPPPPPLPTKEESTQCSEKSISPVKQNSLEKPGLLGPSAHFFDSSQLVSAKKKLKKTGDLEGLQRRRGNHASLLRNLIQ